MKTAIASHDIEREFQCDGRLFGTSSSARSGRLLVGRAGVSVTVFSLVGRSHVDVFLHVVPVSTAVKLVSKIEWLDIMGPMVEQVGQHSMLSVR
ncbi:MAG: hypothetical protein WD069_07840, partial [Planctomycetales bacterium]